MQKLSPTLLALGLTLTLLTPAVFAAGDLATTSQTPTTIDWQLRVEHDGGTLTVSRPDGIVFQLPFRAGENPSLALGDLAEALPDGHYSYQLHAAPRLDAATREALRRARETGNSEAVERDLRAAGKLPAEPLAQSGHFAIAGGTIVPADLIEEKAARAETPAAKANVPLPTPKDQVIPDDLIVQGSICVGFDCVNNESFGFDTIRMKENSTRIKFEDTSASGFPSNDWQLTANDSASGGANKFSIEDITGARVPFTVTAGAATNSIFVDSTGRVGLRTATPVLDLHVNTSNTPALRLEQNSSGGFTAQTWDIAGNEANFFVRDVTSGSRLPFRIRPGAPTSSIDIAADGDVGIGTASPSQKLEVSGGDVKIGRTTGGNTSFFLENTGGTLTSSWILRANGTTGGFTFTEAGGNTSFKINTGALTNALTISSTGVDVTGALKVGGVTLNVPDYVFEPDYQLKSLEEQEAFFREHKHLPAVPKATLGVDGRPVIDLGAYQMGILEELEKAHLYIQQLHGQLEAKADAIADLQTRLARLEAAQN